MRRTWVPALLGLTLIGLAIGTDRQQRRALVEDERGIAMLSARLDSVQALMRTAATGADSARLVQEITQRAYGLGRRTFHIPFQQEAVRGFWRPTGPGTLLSVAGVGLIVVAFGRRRRPVASSA